MSTIIAILIVGVLVLIGFRLAIYFSHPKRSSKPVKALRPSPPMRREVVPPTLTVPAVPTVVFPSMGDAPLVDDIK